MHIDIMNHIDVINKLSTVAEELLKELIPDNRPVAHAWFEESFNFGDSAIWSGQVDLIHKLNLDVRYSCSDADFDADGMTRGIGESGTILLCGGGNFGARNTYHRLRLTILDKFKNNPVIQLPQSVKFDSVEALDITRQVIHAHHDITLLARDRDTRDIFVREFSSADVAGHLCPDMAFLSGVRKRPCDPEVDIVGLLRLDGESNYNHNRGRVYNADIEAHMNLCQPLRNIFSMDDENGNATGFQHNVITDPDHTIEVSDWYLADINNNKDGYQKLDYATKARMGVRLASSILSRGKVVVTDRLHAYILCLQMGIPHVFVDNSYGKLSAFYKTWAEDCAITHRASSMEEAFETARDLCANNIEI